MVSAQKKDKSQGNDLTKAQEIVDVVKGIKFGAVEIIIHDSKIVQIERREKIRFN